LCHEKFSQKCCLYEEVCQLLKAKFGKNQYHTRIKYQRFQITSQFFHFESNWNSIKEMGWNNSVKLTHKWTLASCATSWPFKIKQETIIQVPCALVLLLLLQWALKINSPCYRFIHKACICYHGKTNVPW